MQPKIEQRLFPRIRLKEPLEYQIRGSHDFGRIQTDDISVGGWDSQAIDLSLHHLP